MKFEMYIMAPEPISMIYFINPSHQSVCLHLHSPTVVMQRLGKNVTAATNTHAVEELLDASFPVMSCRMTGKQVISFSLNLLFENNKSRLTIVIN
jgi:hypothetical protein